MNFSKTEMDPINAKKRAKVYKEFNKNVYQYEDDRRSTMEKALEDQKTETSAAVSRNLGGPKGLAEWKK